MVPNPTRLAAFFRGAHMATAQGKRQLPEQRQRTDLASPGERRQQPTTMGRWTPARQPTETSLFPTRGTWRNQHKTQNVQMVIESSPIVNLSQHVLTSDESSVLNKGLSFVPTSYPNQFNIRSDLTRFFRKIRLKYFFLNSPPLTATSVSGLRPPSTFTPKAHQTPHRILAYESMVMRDVMNVCATRSYVQHNITQGERQALETLRNNKLLVIKPADKGGAIVLQDVQQYKEEIYSQLRDGVSYTVSRTNPTRDIRKQIQDITGRGKDAGFLSTKEHEFLNVAQPRTPTIYTLPKIHKSMTKPPGRPIVSGCGSLLEPLCKYIDTFLKPLAVVTPTYVRDTMQIINQVDNVKFDQDKQLLVTLDIVSLYTSIPQDPALSTMRRVLDRRIQPPQVPTDFIIELLEVAMKKNFFVFQDEYFFQSKGVAMGAAFAPDLAILYMAEFEQDHILSPRNPYENNIWMWRRYIDDVLMLWTGGEDELNSFFTWLNTQSQDIQFTMNMSRTSIDFLDISIKVQNDHLHTTLYRKPTERNSLLRYSSHHTRSLRDNLPFGQFLRVRRNCSLKEDYFSESDRLIGRLMERGYPRRLVTRARKRAWFSPREDLLQPKERLDNPDRIVCVTTFCTKSNLIKKAVNKHWEMVADVINHKEPPMHAFKKAKNIRDKVVCSFLETPAPPTLQSIWNLPLVVGHFKCTKCKACPLTLETKVWEYRNHKVNLKTMTNCNTSGVIYAIICPCDLVYIGQTKQHVKKRILQHCSRIRCQTPGSPLVEHFMSKAHTPESFKWLVVEKIEIGPRGGDLNSLLNLRECKWMYTLDTVENGLNELDATYSQLAGLSSDP
ncbi:uncharacterized protein LOC144827386 [Lissotriton helveticus]